MVPFISLKLGYISVRLRPFCSSKIPPFLITFTVFAEFRLAAVLLSLSIYLVLSISFSFFYGHPPLSHSPVCLVWIRVFMTPCTVHSAMRCYSGWLSPLFFSSGCKMFNFCWILILCAELRCVGASICFTLTLRIDSISYFRMVVFPNARSNQAELSWMCEYTNNSTKQNRTQFRRYSEADNNNIKQHDSFASNAHWI